MRNSRASAVIALLCFALPAWADDGYLAQRIDRAAAGSGWLTQDSLQVSGGLGGAVAVTGSYTRSPPGGGVASDLASGMGWRVLVGFEVVGLATADTPTD